MFLRYKGADDLSEIYLEMMIVVPIISHFIFPLNPFFGFKATLLVFRIIVLNEELEKCFHQLYLNSAVI